MNRRTAVWLFLLMAAASITASSIRAQSTSQEFPTPVVSNEISGIIKARAIGDPRLTTYYYLLQGEQGDLFLNLVTGNFSGDIDVFTLNGLRPLAKIVVLADFGESETGRAIYLRRPEKLILRIQGRTPNDDPATFRFKFAGSFAAFRPEEGMNVPSAPRVSSETTGAVRVSSAGTILQNETRIQPAPSREKEAAAALDPEGSKTLPVAKDAAPGASEKAGDEKLESGRPPVEVVVSDPIKDGSKAADPDLPAVPRGEGKPLSADRKAIASERTSRPAVRTSGKKTIERPSTDGAEADEGLNKKAAVGTSGATAEAAKSPSAPPDPMAAITLVIEFKNGRTIEKRMNEVRTFSVNDGFLVVILNDGTASRYSITDVSRVNIENQPQN
ncbi:MAG TPA: hypothetical protein PKD26_11420 [Pyrinomonadaceae bacterium]|nr:hypothetical protein [Pyrinomonadaceae bacterium]